MIESFRSKKNKQYYFRVKSRNHRVIAQSEGYKTARSRDRGVASLIRTIKAIPPLQDTGSLRRSILGK